MNEGVGFYRSDVRRRLHEGGDGLPLQQDRPYLARMRTFILSIAFFLLATLHGQALELPTWTAREQQDHPLTGKALYASGAEAALREIAEAAAKAEFVAIGEIHDNPDHHALQASILRSMAQAGRRPAVVFEMIPRGMQGDVDAFLASASRDAAAFGAAVKWEERGWPDWQTYRPILDVALEYDLPVIAGDLDRDTIRTVGRQGAASLGPDLQARFGLDQPLDGPQQEGLLDAIDKGHCGLMPREALTPMIGVQRARDGSLADAMLAAREKGADGAVLIAGSGHTRRDYGASAVLADLRPQAALLTIAMVEARGGESDPAAYPDAHDFTIVTPAASREDQCEALRRQMGKK